VSTATASGWGGSRAAVQFHYDLGNEFFGLWLDPTRTYSCALWEGPEDRATGDLAAAQLRKIDYHVQQAGAAGGARVLDVGCGWGSTLRRLVEAHGVRQAVGLTLSDAQADFIEGQGTPGVTVLRTGWADHAPAEPYDAIISIGAFEHFARPSETLEERIQVYRGFFSRCAGWLAPGGALSLQTIAYGTLRPEEASAFMQTQIFPEAELPRLPDILAAAEGIFELVRLRNDRLDYARTCERWLASLRANRAAATALVGPEAVARYEKYLKLAALGFYMGKLDLLRLTLRPLVRGWRAATPTRTTTTGR
jgi:cyclopropane-fatty-acyl-phospholipid synthase